MKVYVLGAGVSKTVGYPLAAELFQEIDRYVQNSGSLWNRFDYKNDWPKVCRRLSKSSNSLIAEAYRRRQLEHLFTILDLVSIVRSDTLLGVLYSNKLGPKAVAEAESLYKRVHRVTRSYQESRQILLWALEAYLQFKHHYDGQQVKAPQWEHLKAFGRKVCPGDVVITFNYDSTIERVLLGQEKWSPQDGYGFQVVFQKSNFDKLPATFGTSPVTILHLHGAVGWYKKPIFREDYPLPSEGGAIPREAFTPAPLSTKVSLDPLFLRDLGIQAVDASLPRRPPQEPQIFLHPSFFKDYELEGGSTLFINLWREAARVLRAADEIIIIGYSLPSADSGSLTLFVTNCDRSKVKIVNSNTSANHRLRQLLSKEILAPPQSFQEWLSKVSDCPQQ